MIQKTDTRRSNGLTQLSAAVMVSLATSLSGCGMATFVPTQSSVAFEDPNPLKGSIANVRTLAVLSTAPSGGADMRNALAAAVSGDTKATGALYGPKISEALQKNPRFHIITPYEVEKAVGIGGAVIQIPPSMTEAERASYKTEAILNAGRRVKADGVILIEEEKEMSRSGTGTAMTMMLGRFAAEFRLSVSVVSTETGAVLWRQKAIDSVNASGSDYADLYAKQIDLELVSAVVENFNATMK